MTGQTTEGARLLVVDDERQIADFMRDVAEQIGYVVASADSFEAFRRVYAEFEPAVIALDLQMPGADGVEVLRYMAAQGCRARIIVISGMAQKVLTSARRLGVEYGLDIVGTLQKPIMLKDLREMLKKTEAAPELGADDLREAMQLRQIVLRYQPKIVLSRARVSDAAAAEALVHWQHPLQGLLKPDFIVPLASAAGLIRALTDYVLRMAIEQMKQWQDSGARIAISVNLPPELIDDLEFPDRLAQLLGESGVAASQLCIEITERGAMEHVHRAMDILMRLRLKGIGVSIDDFGTGSSSLVQLFKMPFNELKIDRSFVSEMIDNAEAATIVRVLIDLAHSLGMSACAEGVESKAIAEAVVALGCDTAQGFLYSKSVPPDKLRALFDQWPSAT
ncbi:MAG TPA: EAL domain-containing response regulator [Gammaproteobacteria bacterium]|nr:EAL domain-containing response regulator [Gammaproteobacteria bacterium]